MAILGEVTDAIKAVSETIESIKTISAAINSGKEYLQTNHPQVAQDLIVMCGEMKKSSHALATASAIITHFRFVLGDNNTAEAIRFNDLLVEHKLKAENVEQQINSMRGHCSVIAGHASHIREHADPRGLTTIAAVLGFHSAEKEHELATALQNIYNEEMQYHLGVYAMADAIRTSLQAIQDELGPPGAINPDNVPNAAVALGEYATAFAEIESKCKRNAKELQTSIDSLQKSVS